MSAGNLENDHDYLARRRIPAELQNSEDYEIPVVRNRRSILTLNTQRLTTGASNTDHDYLYAPAAANSGNNVTGVLSGTINADHDIFQDEEDGDDDEADRIYEGVLRGDFDTTSTGTVISRSGSGSSITMTITTGSESGIYGVEYEDKQLIGCICVCRCCDI